jgi:acyl-CoA reductase-like NAD-dependent aldehyde dehydrogenase
MTEETFGPTLPIMVVDSDEEALALANDSPFGLTASVWTSDREQALRLAGKLRAGTVTVNDHNFTHGIPEAPWSGVGESGFGASHGAEGLMELTHPKHINEDRLPLAKNLWWFPYGGKLDWVLNGALKLSGAADTARRFFGR